MSGYEPAEDEIRLHLQRVLQSECFQRSPQARRFLEFVVAWALKRDAGDLKAYTIGVHALGVRDERSCPETVARMQASRVRRLLGRYYESQGQGDELQIQLPVGSYAAQFTQRREATLPPPPSLRSGPLGGLPYLYVEPPECLSAHPADQQFARGLAEQIEARLVPVDGIRVTRNLRAMEASASGFVLSLAMTRAVRSVRLNASVRRHQDGEAIWTKRFDAVWMGDDLYAQQDEWAEKIAAQIGDPVLGAIAHGCRDLWDQGGAEGAIQALTRFLRSPGDDTWQAAKVHLSAAHAGGEASALVQGALSAVLSLSQWLSAEVDPDASAAAEAHSAAAVVEDPECALAHLSRALVHYRARDVALMRRALDWAEQCAGAAAFTRAVIGNLWVLVGEWERGLRLVDHAFEMMPRLPGYLRWASALHALLVLGDAKRALPWAQQMAAEVPRLGGLTEAACWLQLGRGMEARRAAAKSVQGGSWVRRRAAKNISEALWDESWAEKLLQVAKDTGLLTGTELPLGERYHVAHPSRRLPSEIRVGILHSLSGPMAISESHLVQSALRAVDEVNREGGVLGRPVRAIVADGGSEAALFETEARQLLEQQEVHTIFGCWMSSSRKAVLPALERHDALLWYPLQYEGLERSRQVVYTGACLNQQIEPAVRWALGQGMKRVALVGSDYVFPRTANRLIRGLVEAAGGKIVGEQLALLGRADFRPLVDLIADERPDIVFNTVNGADNVALFEALHRAQVHPQTTPVLSFSLSEIELGRLEGHGAGHLACWSYFHGMNRGASGPLAESAPEESSSALVQSDPSMTAYAQVRLWRDVVTQAESLETSALREKLAGSQLDLGGRRLAVRANQHVERPALIGRVTAKQRFEVIWESPELIQPEPWLGVDRADFLGRDLVLGALRALPDMAERAARVEGRAAWPLGATLVG